MKLLALSGSRNHEGRTAQAIKALEEGFTGAGGTVETIFLLDLALERCRQCEIDGWGICRREGRCIIEDDFASVTDKIKQSDLILFATPVYFADLSEVMRSFLDRLRRVRFRAAGPGVRPPQGAPGTPGIPGTQGTPAVCFCLSGGGGGGGPSCMFNLERSVQGSGFNIVDTIIARRQNFDLKLKVMRATGEWLADPQKLVNTPPPPPPPPPQP